MTLWIEYIWHHESFGREQGRLTFSHSDRRNNKSSISWIDHFYLSDYLGAMGKTIKILVGTLMFDHAPSLFMIHNVKYPT